MPILSEDGTKEILTLYRQKFYLKPIDNIFDIIIFMKSRPMVCKGKEYRCKHGDLNACKDGEENRTSSHKSVLFYLFHQ